MLGPLARLLGRGDPPRPTSVQRLLPLAQVEDDSAVLRDGTRVAVLTTTRVNFEMASLPEKEAMLNGYRRLLNSIDHPFQIVIQVSPADIDGYVEQLREGLYQGEGRMVGLDELVEDHADFVRRLSVERRLLQRRLFIVVPATVESAAAQHVGMRGLLTALRRAQPSRGDLATERRVLAMRCDNIGEGLAAIGVRVHRLDSTELATLWRDSIGGLRPVRARREISPDAASPVVIAPVAETEPSS